jgi:hypothetical protein
LDVPNLTPFFQMPSVKSLNSKHIFKTHRNRFVFYLKR